MEILFINLSDDEKIKKYTFYDWFCAPGSRLFKKITAEKT